MKRFFFGVLVGLALAWFFQWRGGELLRAMGIRPEGVCRFVGKMERTIGGVGESVRKAADSAGSKVAEELSR